MTIEYRFVIGSYPLGSIEVCDEQKAVIEFLNLISIKHTVGLRSIALYIRDNDERFHRLNEWLEVNNISFFISDTQGIYNRQELTSAPWLAVRSTWYKYYPEPQDDFGYLQTTYGNTHTCNWCQKGATQKQSFVIRNKPNFGPRHFLTLNWVWDQLFVSNKVIEVFEENNIKGADFWPVYSRSGIEYDNTKQLYVPTLLKPGLCEESIEKYHICKECQYKGMKLNPGFIYFKSQAFDGVDTDIVKSFENTGWCWKTRLTIISQNLYKVLQDNKLAKGLIFDPIKLV